MILYRKDSGPTTITIELTVGPGGSINFAGQDIGEAPKRCFGKSDYEYILTVPPEATMQLLTELLVEKYAGNEHAVSALRSFCEEKQIPHTFWTS